MNKSKTKTMGIATRLTEAEYNKLVKIARRWCNQAGIDFSVSAYMRNLIKKAGEWIERKGVKQESLVK